VNAATPTLDPPVVPDDRAPAAELLGVSRHFTSRGPSGHRATIRAVDDVDLRLERGRTLGLVGESGSGKSTVARVLLRLLPPTSGRVVLDGDDITTVGGARLRHLRRKMQLVFQDPYSSFDPLASIGSSIEEALRVHTDLDRAARRGRAQELLEQVRLPGTFAARRPREVSGGQLQRAAIARALGAEPQLLALDEPVSSLDAATQVQIVDLLAELQERLGIAYLFISHDLSLVRALSDEVAVMYFGRIVESAPVARVFDAPAHPYTQALLAASPSFGRRRADAPVPLTGDVPSPFDPPSGCSFRTRCPYALDVCAEVDPPITRGDGFTVRCHLAEQSRPRHAEPPEPPPTVEPER
jgi:oligopeptide/dipeptide ABC transporter ATP-binding protein